jgi:hypothetical protein
VSEQKNKLLKLMRFWLFGTFVIVWASVTIYIGMFTNRDWLAAIVAGWQIWGAVAVLCIVFYFIYTYILSRRPD